VKTFWYSNPYFHGIAHPGNEYITQAKNEQYNNISKAILEPIGIRVFDAFEISKSRPSESWDGVHYLRGYERWNGHVASTYIQVWLNELFGTCTGNDDQ